MAVYCADQIQERIDAHWKENQDDGRRKHLGGSLIGRECMRELWYSFRWATETKHDGRILRLFQRGHSEEFSFVKYLRQIGVEVRDYDQQLWWSPSKDDYQLFDWDRQLWGGTGDYEPVHDVEWHIVRATGRGHGPSQWRIKDVDGHFGGSLDGIAYGLELEYYPDHFIFVNDPFLLEFKTHGQKSFDKLVKEGLRKAKPEHYAQMQVYMTKRSLNFGLYMAVNKNTDELKCFFVTRDAMDGPALIAKAQQVVHSPMPPDRMHGARPTFFKCRFCDHRATCHMGKEMAKSCRTCAFSKPVEDGQWFCSKWQTNIPDDAQKEGCDHYHAVTE